MLTYTRTKSPAPDRHQLVSRLRRAFVIGTVALIAVALTILGLSAANRASWRLVIHAREESRLARDARALAIERETGLRGYVLSGKEISLAPEIEARPLLRVKLDSLVSLTGGTTQNERARGIRSAVQQWERRYAEPTLARARTEGPAAIAESDTAENALFDNVREEFDSFQKFEESLYLGLVARESFLEKVSVGAVLIEIMLLLWVLLGMRRGTLRQAKELVRQQEHLQKQASELEAQSTELEQSHETVEGVTREKHETLTLLEVVLETAPIGFAFHDREMRYTRINPALAAMAGRSAAEHLGRTPAEVHPDVADIVMPHLRRVVASGKPVTNVAITRPPRNGYVGEQHFLVSFFPVAGVDGSTQGVGVVVLETTERWQLEEQLVQAQKMEAVGRLAGGIAHDFNNILTAIKSYSELLIEDMATNSARVEDVREIREAADRAANLTRQLLAFSRQQMMRPRVLDLNSTVRDLKSMLDRLIGAHVELNTQLAPDLGMLTADPGQVEQVLVNLVVNARDSMAKGGRIDIETANVDLDNEYARTHAATAPGPYVMLAVSDTGRGMTRETQDRVFDPFFTTKGKGKGTGLGLSTVYGIVKQSGGSIWVYSEPGQGTTFKIYFPRVNAEADVTAALPPTNGKGGNETILLVEDEDAVREVSGRILRRSGYTVLEARNGTEALHQCAERGEEIDLIVTDIVMPEMGGLELAERVRQNRPGARILFTSGYSENAVLRRSFLEPGADFIEKPFTPARLVQRAREVLDAHAPVPVSANGNG